MEGNFRPTSAYTGIRKVLHLYTFRSWLEYLRREAVLRALRVRDDLNAQALVEAADAIISLLDKTPIPFEDTRRLTEKISRFSREKITWGIRYPEYRGSRSATFFSRLATWVIDAVSTVEGERALDRAGYPLAENRLQHFAVSVANETQGLLIEAGRTKGQDLARDEMANVIFRGDPYQQVYERHRRIRRTLVAISTGIGGGVTTGLFADNWYQSLGVGIITAAATAVTQFARDIPRLRTDVLAVRRMVRSWLQSMPRLLVRHIARKEGASSAPVEPGKTADLLADILRGDAILLPVNRDSAFYSSLEHLISIARDAEDHETIAHLLDVQRALMFEPDALIDAIHRLMIATGWVEDLAGTRDANAQLLNLERRVSESDGFLILEAGRENTEATAKSLRKRDEDHP